MGLWFRVVKKIYLHCRIRGYESVLCHLCRKLSPDDLRYLHPGIANIRSVGNTILKTPDREGERKSYNSKFKLEACETEAHIPYQKFRPRCLEIIILSRYRYLRSLSNRDL